MKIRHFNTFLFLALLGASASAHAAESLHFNATIPRSSFEKIKFYASNALGEDIQNFDIGKTDLNNDGLDEFITRSKNCEKTLKCRFYIFAETNDSILSLGTFEGKNLLLGNEFRHGIRNLLIFNNPSNDFDYHLYTWHPETSAYRKSGS
ncbi:MAG: hypothetical protein R3E13_03675 [Alphaproteobacteria bacterium]